MPQAKKALLTPLHSPDPSRLHRPGAAAAGLGPSAEEAKDGLLLAFSSTPGAAPKRVRGHVSSPLPLATGFLAQIQFLRASSKRWYSSLFQWPK